MVPVSCADCGIVFSLTEQFHTQRQGDHKPFFCPNGHSNYYAAPKITEEEKKIKDMERTMERRRDSYVELHETLEDWKRAARICPICETRVTTAQFVETIRSKVAEHLRTEHGARPRLRAIPEKASEAQ